jgi:hypothetical protein
MDARVPTQVNNDGGILSSVSNAINKAVSSSPIATPTTFASYNDASINNSRSAFTGMITFNENMFYLILIVFIFMAIIAYILYYIITDDILYQQKIEVDGTNVPIICNELSEFKINKTLLNNNGIKRSYGFWIYINDINKYKGNYRHIAHLGNSTGNSVGEIKNASPYIFLDDEKNSIHVRFAPKDDPISTATRLNGIPAGNLDQLLNYGGKKCGITIKYIPIQRWVYIVIVISDINGGLIYTYIDGELSEIERGKDKMLLHEINFETKPGSLYVGGNIANSYMGAAGFSGLLSKFSIYNFDLNKNDIYKEYNRGPLNGLLTSLGIVSYGLRNPVYKINNVY